jgi:hypothetical protein
LFSWHPGGDSGTGSEAAGSEARLAGSITPARNSSDILREALKLWLIRANLKPRQALAIINRTTHKIECEVVLTPE